MFTVLHIEKGSSAEIAAWLQTTFYGGTELIHKSYTQGKQK